MFVRYQNYYDKHISTTLYTCIRNANLYNQVYDRTMSYFVDDSGLGFAARGTQSISGRLLDAAGYMRIGQTHEGNCMTTLLYNIPED